MSYDILLAVATLLYLLFVLLFYRGLRIQRDITSNPTRPFVSVVIAARNEEQMLSRCLESVLQQSYPHALYEVIVADDNSEDRTREISESFAHRHANVHTFSVQQQTLRGKTNALAQAIDQAKGELIFVTDADCVVPYTWLEATIRRYDDRVGIVGGMTLQQSKTSFEGMQSIDWAFLLGIASAAASMRNPLSTIGNNLSFRRKAYDDVGGYRSIKFSVTEDYALFHAIVDSGKWEYLYPIDSDLLVMSEPCKRFRDLLQQKHRWGKGGVDMTLSGFAIMAIGFLQHAAILLALAAGHFTAAATAFLLKSSADYFFLHRILSRLKRTDELKYFYTFEVYYLLYVLILPFLVFLGGKVHWKGRSY